MKLWLSAFALTLLLAACGSNNQQPLPQPTGQAPQGGLQSWPQDKVRQLLLNCENSLLGYQQTYCTPQQAKGFCQCFYGRLANTWSYQRLQEEVRHEQQDRRYSSPDVNNAWAQCQQEIFGQQQQR